MRGGGGKKKQNMDSWVPPVDQKTSERLNNVQRDFAIPRFSPHPRPRPRPRPHMYHPPLTSICPPPPPASRSDSALLRIGNPLFLTLSFFAVCDYVRPGLGHHHGVRAAAAQLRPTRRTLPSQGQTPPPRGQRKRKVRVSGEGAGERKGERGGFSQTTFVPSGGT